MADTRTSIVGDGAKSSRRLLQKTYTGVLQDLAPQITSREQAHGNRLRVCICSIPINVSSTSQLIIRIAGAGLRGQESWQEDLAAQADVYICPSSSPEAPVCTGERQLYRDCQRRKLRRKGDSLQNQRIGPERVFRNEPDFSRAP